MLALALNARWKKHIFSEHHLYLHVHYQWKMKIDNVWLDGNMGTNQSIFIS